MPEIRSANPDFPILTDPGPAEYRHPAALRRGRIPMAFQVTSPFGRLRALLPHALVLHVNPQNFQFTNSKAVERFQTRGGWVEQHWGDQLDEIRCDGSTGAFMNIYTGLTSILRQRTIAWDRFRDLHDLYRNNGSVYDPTGAVVLQGQIMLLYDQGAYLGTFRTFEFEETADSPFAFHISWTFKVEHTVWQVPGAGTGQPVWGPDARAPAFQGQNALDAPNALAAQQRPVEGPGELPTYDETPEEIRTRLADEKYRREEGLPSKEDQLRQERMREWEEQKARQRLIADRQEQLRKATGAPTEAEKREQRGREIGAIPTQSGKSPGRG
jgi:hypothetical protein